MKSVSISLGVSALVVVCSCKSSDPPLPSPRARASASGSSSARGAASTPAPSALPRVPPDLRDAAERAVRAWNDALSRHHVGKLEELYAGTVLFYGRTRSKAAVVAAKRAAFAKQPTYYQEVIGEISLARLDDATIAARFLKKSGDESGFSVDPARLVLTRNGNGFLVTEEADEASVRGQNSIPEGCTQKAAEVVDALTEVKRADASAMAEAEASDGGKRLGGIRPNEDGEGGFRVATGIHTDERFEERVGYAVDRKGHLLVWVLGSDVTLSADALKSVAEACRH